MSVALPAMSCRCCGCCIPVKYEFVRDTPPSRRHGACSGDVAIGTRGVPQRHATKLLSSPRCQQHSLTMTKTKSNRDRQKTQRRCPCGLWRYRPAGPRSFCRRRSRIQILGHCYRRGCRPAPKRTRSQNTPATTRCCRQAFLFSHRSHRHRTTNEKERKILPGVSMRFRHPGAGTTGRCIHQNSSLRTPASWRCRIPRRHPPSSNGSRGGTGGCGGDSGGGRVVQTSGIPKPPSLRRIRHRNTEREEETPMTRLRRRRRRRFVVANHRVCQTRVAARARSCLWIPHTPSQSCRGCCRCRSDCRCCCCC
mmetsp:Transcript_4153/g.9649  ORF Transcript_4153/g.9649 Transcript_4153/m.9649 type:complete len:308 (-) Transcript_4153:41-964(-)